MRYAEFILESEATERILEETENAIAKIERILRKPLSPSELSEILSQYMELTREQDAFHTMSAVLDK